MVAVVERTYPQEDSTSDVQLRSSGCAGDPGLHFGESVEVNSPGLKGCEAEDVDLSSRIGDSLSVDFRGNFWFGGLRF